MSSSISVTANKEIRKGNFTRRYAFGFYILIFCLLGCGWIYKGNYHRRLSGKLLELQVESRKVEATQMNLFGELADVSQVTIISDVAKKKLGMIPSRVPPDTVWCKTASQMPSLGSLSFFTL